jgi:REP element-mobilizing transposase RayT
MHWLFEARKRYGLSVLNYVATSNHIHLLALDRGREAISKSMQLVSGRTAQAFNLRKKRKGAFWEDRYHATAVETNHHLVACLTYIDLNMVRAGVVAHPSEWQVGGYAEMPAGREGKWTESVAVGSADFVRTIRTKLGSRAKERRISGMEDNYTLREPQELLGVKS